jgi:hypothetical protein
MKVTSMTAAEDRRRAPCVVVATPRQGQQQRHHAGHQGDRAEVVDAPLADHRANIREREPQHGQCDQPDRQVHVEDPAPAQVVGQVTAQERPDDARQAENTAENALNAAALSRRKDLRDDRKDGRREHTTGQPLQSAKDDELGHVLAETAQGGGQDEHGRAAEQEELAAVHVRQLAGDRHDGRAGEQIGGGDPGVVLKTLQLGDDARHGRADDGLVKRGQ